MLEISKHRNGWVRPTARSAGLFQQSPSNVAFHIHTLVMGLFFFKGVRRRSQKDLRGLYDNGFQKAAFLLLQALQTWKVLRELVLQLQHLSDLQSDMLR